MSTGDDALKVMQIVDAVYRSAKAGKEIIFK
jgi:predicted dehydrogenase